MAKVGGVDVYDKEYIYISPRTFLKNHVFGFKRQMFCEFHTSTSTPLLSIYWFWISLIGPWKFGPFLARWIQQDAVSCCYTCNKCDKTNLVMPRKCSGFWNSAYTHGKPYLWIYYASQCVVPNVIYVLKLTHMFTEASSNDAHIWKAVSSP